MKSSRESPARKDPAGWEPEDLSALPELPPDPQAQEIQAGLQALFGRQAAPLPPTPPFWFRDNPPTLPGRGPSRVWKGTHPATIFERWRPVEIAVILPEPVPEEPGCEAESALPNPGAVLETVRQEQEMILAMANQQADGMVAAALQQAESLLQKAEQASHDIRRQAQIDGEAAGRAEIAGLLALAGEVVYEVRRWREAMLRSSEPQIVDLVQAIAGCLFGNGYRLPEAQLGPVIERALAEAKSLGSLRLRVHPEDAAALGALWAGQQASRRGQAIELVPDQDIQPGGVLIEGQYGSVDGRLEAQLNLVKTALNETLAERSQENPAFAPYPCPSEEQPSEPGLSA